MKIISGYIFRAHIGPFLFGFSTVVFLFLMQFVINSLDKLVGKGLDPSIIFQLVVLNIPWMVVLAAPMGVLFSTILAFGNLSSNYEIPVIKSSGGSLIQMMTPMIFGGLLLSLFMFWFNDYVLPESNHQAKVLMSDIQRKKPTFAIEKGQFSTQIEGNIILSRGLDSASGMLYDVTIYDTRRVDERNIISADSGKIGFSEDYNNLIIDLFHGEIHSKKTNSLDDYRIIDFKKYNLKLSASGFDFNRTEGNLISRGDREMRISDMKNVVQEAEQKKHNYNEKIDSLVKSNLDYLLSGNSKTDTAKTLNIREQKMGPEQLSINNLQKKMNFLEAELKSKKNSVESAEKNIRKYEVEIWKKYAIPLACLVFVFVGAPLGIRTKGGNFGISAAISLGFYIIYWACLIGGEKLADRGITSPILSMFLANIIVGFIGLILTIKTNNEMFEIRSIFKKSD